MEDDKGKKQIIKRKTKDILKVVIFKIIYLSTSCIPVYVFYYTFRILKYCFECSFSYAFISIVAMDFIWYCTETLKNAIYMRYLKVQQKRLLAKKEEENKKQEQINQLESILIERNNYDTEIQEAKEQNKQLKNKIKGSEEVLPKDIIDRLIQICDSMGDILKILKKDTEEYYPIRHTFKVYFPEFCKMTYTFLDIAKGDSLDEESILEFKRLIEEFNQYLDYIKGSINKRDKLNLNVGVKSLVKILESERKKGES